MEANYSLYSRLFSSPPVFAFPLRLFHGILESSAYSLGNLKFYGGENQGLLDGHYERCKHVVQGRSQWPNFSVICSESFIIQVRFSYFILNRDFDLVGISKQGYKHKQ